MNTVPQNKKDPLRGPDARSVEGAVTSTQILKRLDQNRKPVFNP